MVETGPFDPYQIIRSIALPSMLPIMKDWHLSIKPEEKKGLKIIQAIMKHKGEKKLRAKHKKEEDKDVMLSADIDHKQAYEMMKVQNFQSSYTQANSGLMTVKYPAIEILKYKKFSILPCSNVLTDLCKRYVDHWISLKDDEYYQSLVLKSARFLNSLVTAVEVPKSHNTHTFIGAKPGEVVVKRLDKQIVAQKATAEAPQKVADLAQFHGEKKAKIEMPKPVTESRVDPKAIKADLMRGNGNIIGSCFGVELTSSYQHNYKTPPVGKIVMPIKRGIKSQEGMVSRMVGGICPDPRLMAREKEKKAEFEATLNNQAETVKKFRM